MSWDQLICCLFFSWEQQWLKLYSRNLSYWWGWKVCRHYIEYIFVSDAMHLQWIMLKWVKIISLQYQIGSVIANGNFWISSDRYKYASKILFQESFEILNSGPLFQESILFTGAPLYCHTVVLLAHNSWVLRLSYGVLLFSALK